MTMPRQRPARIPSIRGHRRDPTFALVCLYGRLRHYDGGAKLTTTERDEVARRTTTVLAEIARRLRDQRPT